MSTESRSEAEPDMSTTELAPQTDAEAENSVPSPPASQDQLPVAIIERSKGWGGLRLGELWRYREVLYFLTWRDVKIRYKQTILGAMWAILQPLATMVVFTIFLGRAGVVHSIPYPYELFVLAGLLPWMFYGNSLIQAGQSLVHNHNLVTKVYFPRLLIPTAAIGACVVDFLISFAIMIGMMAIYSHAPSWNIFWVPPILILLTITAIGVGSMLSALTVAYRDFRFVIPFAVQLWMFATPSIYMQADKVVGEAWRPWLPLNPVYGLIVNFRQAMLGGPMDFYSLLVSGSVSIVLLCMGLFYFRNVERSMADVI